MQNLIVKRGFTKRAAEEDGPSFEQQFGILATAVIADKFPKLDNMKLAFQLIEKTDDNQKACGAAVYMVGKNVIFVPAFFKNNKLQTGDMMFIAQTQQFLPLADPWLAWLYNKDLTHAGDEVPPGAVETTDGAKGTTIREISDPIMKTAAVYLRGLLHTDPDLRKHAAQASLLDTALAFGKNASETLLDNLIKKPDFLNATLAFYSGDELDAFAKKASAMAEELPTVELILPLDKEAKTLSDKELKALYKDGFFIRKTAADKREVPSVIRTKQLEGMFAAIRDSGKAQLLLANGDVKDAVIVRKRPDTCCDGLCGSSCYELGRKADPGMTADSYISSKGKLYVADANGLHMLPPDAMAMVGNRDAFSEDMLDGIGQKLSDSSIKRLPWGAQLVFGDGTFVCIEDGYAKSEDGSFVTASSSGDYGTQTVCTISISNDSDGKLLTPMKSGNTLVVPSNTRVVMPNHVNADGTSKKDLETEQKAKPAPACVTMATIDAFISEYCKKNYHKTRIWHDGSEYVISGDKSDGQEPKSVKEAALQLVTEYAVDPAVAKIMIKEAANGATYNNPKSTTFFITKTAEEQAEWRDASLPMAEIRNIPPQVHQEAMPTVLENPEQLQQAAMAAAQAGIKEVFDVTAMKLLVRQNRFFDEIHEDIPLFMQALDSLCRKLFQFYWHTDKMEEKYGMIKMKALEESLKNTLDSLSELTVFFKLRSVDGTGSTGDITSDLMAGQLF